MSTRGRSTTGERDDTNTDHALNSDEAAQTLRRFYDSASVLMGTVELNDDDIVHVSDNKAAATFFGTTSEG